ncbi:hypothetical protein [Streptomyces sp. NPDC001594]|uniref:hypothetical protein n=1 Tax=Streptomyces sp. NPDC001594 TaxID=3364590 RepID=UPI00367B6ECE
MDSIGTNTAPEAGATPLAAPAAALAPALTPAPAPVPFPAPDLVTVSVRQGLEAVDIIRRGAGQAVPAVGPVLHDCSGDTLGFLVPPGTADAWDLPGSACTQTNGRGMRFGDLAAAPTAGGTGWLLPPEAVGPVTDPEVLRAALGEAARLIEAADNCR